MTPIATSIIVVLSIVTAIVVALVLTVGVTAEVLAAAEVMQQVVMKNEVHSLLIIILIRLSLTALHGLSIPLSLIFIHQLHMRLGVAFLFRKPAMYLRRGVKLFRPFLWILLPGRKLPTFFSKSERITTLSFERATQLIKLLFGNVSRTGTVSPFGDGILYGDKRLHGFSFLSLQ